MSLLWSRLSDQLFDYSKLVHCILSQESMPFRSGGAERGNSDVSMDLSHFPLDGPNQI